MQLFVATMKIGVSSRSGDRIIKNDLKARSNKIREVPSVGMSAADRLERTRKLLSYVKSKGSSPKAKTRKCEFSVMKNFLSVIKYWIGRMIDTSQTSLLLLSTLRQSLIKFLNTQPRLFDDMCDVIAAFDEGGDGNSLLFNLSICRHFDQFGGFFWKQSLGQMPCKISAVSSSSLKRNLDLK